MSKNLTDDAIAARRADRLAAMRRDAAERDRPDPLSFNNIFWAVGYALFALALWSIPISLATMMIRSLAESLAGR